MVIRLLAALGPQKRGFNDHSLLKKSIGAWTGVQWPKKEAQSTGYSGKKTARKQANKEETNEF